MLSFVILSHLIFSFVTSEQCLALQIIIQGDVSYDLPDLLMNKFNVIFCLFCCVLSCTWSVDVLSALSGPCGVHIFPREQSFGALRVEVK